VRILLIHPQNYLQRRSTGIYGRSLRYAPLTMPTLKALVPPELGAEVRIMDEMVEDVAFDDPADLVGITAITGTAPRAYEIADRFRARGATVVLGGVHPTLRTEESLQHARAVKAEVFLSNALINLGWVHHWLGDVEAALGERRAAVGQRHGRLELRDVVVRDVADDGLAAGLGFGEITEVRAAADERVPAEAPAVDGLEQERGAPLPAQPKVRTERSDEVCGDCWSHGHDAPCDERDGHAKRPPAPKDERPFQPRC